MCIKIFIRAGAMRDRLGTAGAIAHLHIVIYHATCLTKDALSPSEKFAAADTARHGKIKEEGVPPSGKLHFVLSKTGDPLTQDSRFV